MNKVLIYFIVNLTFIFYACRQSSGRSLPEEKNISEGYLSFNSIPSTADYISGYGNQPDAFISLNPSLLPAESIVLFTGKISKNDIHENSFILDTLFSMRTDSTYEVFYNKIYGYTQTNYFIYNSITQDRPRNELEFYSFSRDTIIIPFRFDIDNELTLLTRWRVLDTDSLAYLDYFKTPIGTKYSSLQIPEVLRMGENRFMLFKIYGGEGGEQWEEILLAKILMNNRLRIHSLSSVGGDFGGDTLPRLQYEIIKDGIKVYKVLYQNDNTTNLPSKQPLSRELISKFMLRDF